MKRTRYVVHLPNDEVARFSECEEALRYGRERSYLASVEVSAPSGLIGQFRDRRATEEFAHLDRAP